MKKLLKAIAWLALVAMISLYTPTIHRLWLRHKVEKEVVKITNKEMNHGGTGSHIKLPSGNVAIITNSHVCGIADEHGILYISQDGTEAIPRKIIRNSESTDLCLVEPLPGHSGLDVSGSEVYEGEEIYAVGHPRLMSTTMTQGEIIDIAIVDVIDHLGGENCSLPKNKIIQIPFLFGTVEACAIHIAAYETTVPILPGSSGSPAVNKSGKVIGLMFASDTEAHWGLIVTWEQLTDFIKMY